MTFLNGLELEEHTFDLPLDHARPDGAKIQIFAREVRAPGGLGKAPPPHWNR